MLSNLNDWIKDLGVKGDDKNKKSMVYVNSLGVEVTSRKIVLNDLSKKIVNIHNDGINVHNDFEFVIVDIYSFLRQVI